jgi:hypothetical protein
MRVSGSNPAGGANFSSNSDNNSVWTNFTQEMAQLLNQNPPNYASIKALAAALYPLLSHCNNPQLKQDLGNILDDLKSFDPGMKLRLDINKMQKDFQNAGTITITDPQHYMASALNEFLSIAGTSDSIDGQAILQNFATLAQNLLPKDKDAIQLIQQAAANWQSDPEQAEADIESAIISINPMQ